MAQIWKSSKKNIGWISTVSVMQFFNMLRDPFVKSNHCVYLLKFSEGINDWNWNNQRYFSYILTFIKHSSSLFIFGGSSFVGENKERKSERRLWLQRGRKNMMSYLPPGFICVQGMLQTKHKKQIAKAKLNKRLTFYNHNLNTAYNIFGLFFLRFPLELWKGFFGTAIDFYK